MTILKLFKQKKNRLIYETNNSQKEFTDCYEVQLVLKRLRVKEGRKILEIKNKLNVGQWCNSIAYKQTIKIRCKNLDRYNLKYN